MTIDAITAELIQQIYGDVPGVLARGIAELERCVGEGNNEDSELWSERDVVLITYADQVVHQGPTLRSLQDFLLGSTAARVVRHATCSVLVIR